MSNLKKDFEYIKYMLSNAEFTSNLTQDELYDSSAIIKYNNGEEEKLNLRELSPEGWIMLTGFSDHSYELVGEFRNTDAIAGFMEDRTPYDSDDPYYMEKMREDGKLSVDDELEMIERFLSTAQCDIIKSILSGSEEIGTISWRDNIDGYAWNQTVYRYKDGSIAIYDDNDSWDMILASKKLNL